jgi:hypothetical protein
MENHMTCQALFDLVPFYRSDIRLLQPRSKSYHLQSSSIEATMFLQRSAIAAARRAAISPIVKRSFTSSFVRRKSFRRVLNPESWF